LKYDCHRSREAESALGCDVVQIVNEGRLVTVALAPVS